MVLRAVEVQVGCAVQLAPCDEAADIRRYGGHCWDALPLLPGVSALYDMPPVLCALRAHCRWLLLYGGWGPHSCLPSGFLPLVLASWNNQKSRAARCAPIKTMISEPQPSCILRAEKLLRQLAAS